MECIMKEFFDWFRAEMGGKLTQAQVDYANELLEKMDIEQVKTELLAKYQSTPPKPANADWHMKLSDKGFEMLALFEGFRSKPYRDSVGVPTIGYGNTYYYNDKGEKVKVTMSTKPLSKDEARKLKIEITNKDFAPAVNRLLEKQIKNGEISQNMFDALISLAYNIGIGGLSNSRVIRHLKNGDKLRAGNAFLLWRNAGGRPILLKRRQKEREIFLS